MRFQQTTLADALRRNSRTNCINMDIEGSELDILRRSGIPKRIQRTQCLVVGVDASVTNCRRSSSVLKLFSNV